MVKIRLQGANWETNEYVGRIPCVGETILQQGSVRRVVAVSHLPMMTTGGRVPFEGPATGWIFAIVTVVDD